jgi:hypothetical protein
MNGVREVGADDMLPEDLHLVGNSGNEGDGGGM